MNQFEIRVTNVESKNDLATTSFFDGNDEDANHVMEIVERALSLKNELHFMSGDTVIHIAEASDENGFYYTRYASEKDYQDDNDMDGGLCTGTLSDAIDMAIN